MSDDVDEKLKIVVNKKLEEIGQKASAPVVEASPGEVDETPLGDVEALESEPEDEEYPCYSVRRRPGESSGVEYWFKDNSVRQLSYGYFRGAGLNKARTAMMLLFTGAKVVLRGRGLVNLVSLINEKKITRLIEQHRKFDREDDEVFISEIVAEIDEMEEDFE